jgi:hypothetical protein
MRPAFLYWMAASLLLGIVWVALLPRDHGQSRSSNLISMALAGLTLALLAVGVVSHTLIRHVVQVTPPVVALMLVARRPSLGTAAAIPLFTFWLGLMILIWLFLLDVVRLISGHFTTTEIALTIVIALMSGLGLVSVARSRSSIGPATRFGIATLFACLQGGALVLSMQPWAIFR